MLFKRISRTDAEKAYIVVQNVSGSTLTAGYSCVFDTSASVDGVRVTQASAGDVSAFAGVADADIANSSYGLVQVYGYRRAHRRRDCRGGCGGSGGGEMISNMPLGIDSERDA